MAALSSCRRLLRRASSSFQIPLSRSSSVLHLRNRILASQFLPLSTSSANSPPEGSPPGTDIRSFGTSEKLPVPDGLPFDSVEEDPADGSVTLIRRFKDEIFEIKATKPEPFCEKDICQNLDFPPMLLLDVKILYGNNFSKYLELLCRVRYDDRDQFRIGSITFSSEDKRNGEAEIVGPIHLEEFEDFFKKRGIEHGNFNFLLKYLEKRNEIAQLVA